MNSPATAAVSRPADRFSETNNSIVLHFITLRRALGVLGIALPFVLVAGENLRDILVLHAPSGGRQLIELSISAYFHTGMREVFVGTLCAVGVFLIAYRGYERVDNLLANVAGAAALAVAAFPTMEKSREAYDAGGRVVDSVTWFSDAMHGDPAIIGVIHFLAAGVFFLALAAMSYFVFTRTDGPTPQKLTRNRIYRACGIVMALCIAGVAIGKLLVILHLLSDGFERSTSFVFWFEAIGLVFFGISWLVKGETIFRDARPATA